MPISDFALQGLRTLRPGINIDEDYGALSGQPNIPDLIHGRIAQENQLQEMKRRLDLQKALPHIYTTGATPADASDLESTLASDPDFGEAARARTAARSQAYDTAMSQGFRGSDPVGELAAYGRKQAEAKLQQPMDIARINEEGALGRQRLANEGQLALEAARQKGSTDYLQQLLSGGGAGTVGGRISHVDPRTGSVSFGAPVQDRSKISPQTWALLAKTRGEVGSPWFGGLFGKSSSQVKLDQAIEGAFAQHPASVDVKSMAHKLVNDPKASTMPFEQIATIASQTYGLSLEEVDHLRDLVGILRGSDF